MCRITDFFAQDWISGSSGNDKGKGRADPNSTSNATMPSLSELRAQFVVVPPGDEAKSISCPICKENMKSEFMEDDEEWVWRNAVMKGDKVSHGSLYLPSSRCLTRLVVDLSCYVSC